MTTPTRILLADDHALVRAGIHSLLQGMREVKVVAEASSGEEALEVADRERPDPGEPVRASEEYRAGDRGEEHHGRRSPDQRAHAHGPAGGREAARPPGTGTCRR